MARKIYPYSLDRKDAKIAGVCSTLGAMAGSTRPSSASRASRPPLFTELHRCPDRLRDVGIYLAIQKKRAMTGERQMSDFDRMGEVAKRKPTVHAMRTELDETDRRLMAIDHHINTQNDELAREIEALRRGGEVMDPLTIGSAERQHPRRPRRGELGRAQGLERLARAQAVRADPRQRPTLPPATGRIEIADLRERVRKLEAIAAGIDI